MSESYQTFQPEGFPGLPSDWQSEWGTFRDRAGKLDLFGVLHFKKDQPIRRAALVVHGQGEHGGRYLHLPHYLKDTFDAVYCFDLRGHGRSSGIQGHAEQFDDYADDAFAALEQAQKVMKRFGHDPEWHLIGHSMGGLVSLRLLLLHSALPFASASLSSPLLGIAVRVPVVKRYAGYALANIWGSLQMATTLEAGMVSHDPAVTGAYAEDKLNHNKVTPKFFVGLEKTMEDTMNRASELHHTPIQFLVAMGDVIVDPNATLQFYSRMTQENRRMVKFDDYFHEIFNEGGPDSKFDKERPLSDVSDWAIENSKATEGESS